MTDERMTDAEWHSIHSFLSTCPDIRVGQEDHGRLFVDAACGMARSGTTDACRPHTGKGTRSIAAWPIGARGASGRA